MRLGERPMSEQNATRYTRGQGIVNRDGEVQILLPGDVGYED